jgi:hypothetical protein
MRVMPAGRACDRLLRSVIATVGVATHLMVFRAATPP